MSMTDPDNLRKMAEVHEAIEEIDGVEVTERDVAKKVADDQEVNPMLSLFGSLIEPEMEEVGIFVCRFEDDRPDYPDDPKPEDLEQETESE